ncbi:MAG: hypothetical protein ACREFY_07215 [Acetobacteraceae bacterium]
MRLMFRAMIASSSLAAFSASVMKAGLSPIQGAAPPRPFGMAQSTPQPLMPLQLAPAEPSQISPQAPLPRGSLLDLSV